MAWEWTPSNTFQDQKGTPRIPSTGFSDKLHYAALFRMLSSWKTPKLNTRSLISWKMSVKHSYGKDSYHVFRTAFSRDFELRKFPSFWSLLYESCEFFPEYFSQSKIRWFQLPNIYQTCRVNFGIWNRKIKILNFILEFCITFDLYLICIFTVGMFTVGLHVK